MISHNMSVKLNDQINAELNSAYLYLSMSLDADSKALKGVANWFFIQWLEEQDHARIFQEYLLDQDEKVRLQPIGEVPNNWKTPLQMFKEALEHEKEVTRLINELVKLSFKERDMATLSRLRWFVDEQLEEEASVKEQVDAFSRIEGYPQLIGPLDKELMERTYKKAEPLEDR